MISLEGSIASATQAAAAFRAAGYNRIADLIGARPYDLAGCHIDIRDEDAVWAAIEADGLDPVMVEFQYGGGNTTGADGREVVVGFAFPWDAQYHFRRTLYACLPETPAWTTSRSAAAAQSAATKEP